MRGVACVLGSLLITIAIAWVCALAGPSRTRIATLTAQGAGWVEADAWCEDAPPAWPQPQFQNRILWPGGELIVTGTTRETPRPDGHITVSQFKELVVRTGLPFKSAWHATYETHRWVVTKTRIPLVGTTPSTIETRNQFHSRLRHYRSTEHDVLPIGVRPTQTAGNVVTWSVLLWLASGLLLRHRGDRCPSSGTSSAHQPSDAHDSSGSAPGTDASPAQTSASPSRPGARPQ